MRKIFLILFFTISVNAWSLTLSEIRTHIRRNVRDTATSAEFQRYSDDDLTDLINTAQREVVNTVWMITSTTSFTSVASTMFYDQSTDFIAPIKVTYLKTGTTANFELTEKTLSGLFATNSNWENATGTPSNYYVRLKPGGTVKQIGLYPAPVSASTGTVNVTYVLIPNDLSSSSSVPFNGVSAFVPYHKALVDYVSGLIKQIEGKNDEANGYFSLAGAEINRMKERLGELPNYNPGMVGGSPR